MKLTRKQMAALHELVKELDGSQHDPKKKVKQEEKFAPLKELTDEELITTLRHVGNVATCDDCDHWTAIEELDENGVCSNCEDFSEDPE